MIKTAEIRPKLKQSSVFLQTDEGVFFQSGEATFRLKGKAIGRWISALSPYMTGEYTLNELCDRLEPAYRENVGRLVDVLLERGILKNAVQEEPTLLNNNVRRYFRKQLAFIDHYVDRPLERFQTFRESRILLTGSGEALISLALCLIRNGMKEVLLSPTDGSEAYLERLHAEVEALHREGCETNITFVTSQNSQMPDADEFANYDLVTYCADNGSLKEVFALNQYCANNGRAFLAATIFAGQAVIGPLFKAPQGPCWLCAQMRLAANADDQYQSALWRTLALGEEVSSQETTYFIPNAQRIGHGLGFEVFKILTGAVPSEIENGVILQNLETLESFHGKLSQHPLCPICSHNDAATTRKRLEEVVEGRHDNSQQREEYTLKLYKLLDTRNGVFHSFADDNLLQLPLKTAQLTGAAPASPLGKEIDSRAFSLENVIDARDKVLFAATGQYAQALPDVRGMRIASTREMKEAGKAVVTAQQLCVRSGAPPLPPDRQTEWLPAFSPIGQHYCFVPAAAVYPCSALNRRGIFERTHAGSAVGLTYRDVLGNGMITALGYEFLRELANGRKAVIELDVDELETQTADADLAYLLRSAKRFERPFAVMEIVQCSPLSLTIVHTTGIATDEIATIGIGFSGREATKKALLDFVGIQQSLKNERTMPALPDGNLFPGFSPRAGFAQANVRESRFGESEVTMAVVEDYLRERGYDVFFINTTPQDIWETETLISGKILLARAVQEL